MVGGQAYSIDGDMWQAWDGVVGCGDMWQSVGACGRGGGRVWGHVAGVGVFGRCDFKKIISRLILNVETKDLYVRNLWIEPVNIKQGVGACGRVWGHVAGVGVFGRGSGLWHGWGHVVQGMW